MDRRDFLKRFGFAAGGITISPLLIKRLEAYFSRIQNVRVYKVFNGDCMQNTEKLWQMLNISDYFNPDDLIVIKGNGQWPNQGYTHTGVIKVVIDKILEIPGFSGEIIICDNIQEYGGPYGFYASEKDRIHNWSDHNWSTLADEYQKSGKPVSIKRWLNSETDISTPGDGEGWVRDFFSFHGQNTYLSYPVFESKLTPGRMIDMKNGVWENGDYTGQKVKAVFIPTLNNHGWGKEDYAGMTGAIKSFFGATEIHGGATGLFRGYRNIHNASFTQSRADYAGELVARYIQTIYQPVLFITAAMWSGHDSRTGDAVETKTVLACENPVTLDYIAARDVISPYASFLNPDLDNNTRKQITGCIAGGIGTINPDKYEVISYDFNNPTINRLDIDRKIKEYKEGDATEQEVLNLINEYMENG